MPPCERPGAPSWAAPQRAPRLDLVAVAVHLEVDAPRARAPGERAVVVARQPAGGIGSRRASTPRWSGPSPVAWRARVEPARSASSSVEATSSSSSGGGVVTDEGVAEVADRPPGARSLLGDSSTSASDRRRLVEGVEQRVPGERGALDAHRELDDALQRLEVAEGDVGSPSPSPLGSASSIDIIPLNRRTSARTSSTRAALDRLASSSTPSSARSSSPARRP